MQLIGIVIYLAVLLLIGLLTARQMKDLRDYYAGGKRFGFWAAAFSWRATGESAWLLIGLTGRGAAVERRPSGLCSAKSSGSPQLGSSFAEDSNDERIATIRGLGFLGSPQIFVRFLSTRSEKEIRRGAIVAVFWFAIFGWSGISATFCPTMILSLYWRKLTASGALSAMLAGFASVPFFKFVAPQLPMVGDSFATLSELPPAFVVSTVVAIVVSLHDRRGQESLVDPHLA